MSYILKDAQDNAMWSNGKMNHFIRNIKEAVPFTVHVMERQTCNKDGNERSPVTLTAAA